MIVVNWATARRSTCTLYSSWTDSGPCQSASAALYMTRFGFFCNIDKRSADQTGCCIPGGVCFRWEQQGLVGAESVGYSKQSPMQPCQALYPRPSVRQSPATTIILRQTSIGGVSVFSCLPLILLQLDVHFRSDGCCIAKQYSQWDTPRAAQYDLFRSQARWNSVIALRQPEEFEHALSSTYWP